MAPPVWTLVLLVGSAWGQGHMPTPVRKEKPPDWKPGDRSSTDNSILTQCDFEDDAKPLCDWTQESTDDGDWIRTSGPSPTGSTGPPGGYPNGEGHYLHMDSNTFHRGGVARLQSPPLWVQGPLCVYFAYHMFGLSWGAQLKLLLLRDTKKKHPSLLWKHINTQRPSWMPTAVTVPMGLVLPSRLTFEGMRGSTAYLDISLDAISIHRGSCNRVCMMQTCSFDIPNDLCGWSWIPTASGAKWVQKKGPSKVPNVGPEDDFSSPGSGFYMLLDPKNAKPRQKSVLLSPLRHSSGCMSLSFHYILRGQSPGAALIIYAAILGSIRKHTLFSGQPGPNWQPASVNYTGQGQIQFTVVGVFGETPEPAVAVDAISIAPCGEGFPQCDFEDDAHPFCDWAQVSGDGGHWTRGNKNIHIRGAGNFGVFFSPEGPYIYVEANKFSVAGQSFRLVSRPFCAPGAICVEFAYHMYGLGEGTKLSLLLESPAGSAPSTLWHRTGSQSPNWLNASVTIPLGHQQPMQLILEAIRGTNTAFVVAVGFILINHGTCRGPTSSAVPTEKNMAPTEKHTFPSEIATVPTKKPMVPSEIPIVPTEKPTIPTERTTIPTAKPTIPAERFTIPTEKLTVPTTKPTISTESSTVPTENPTIPAEKPTIPTEKTMVSTERPTIPTEKPTILTEKTTILTEKLTVPTEKTTTPTENPTIPTEKTTIPTENSTVPTENPTIPAEKPTITTEKIMVSMERPTIPTEKPIIPTEKTTMPTEKPIVPTEKPIIPTEKSTVPTEKPTILTEKHTVPTEKLTIPTEKLTVPIEKPTVPTEKTMTTVPTERPTIPTEKTTIPTERPTIPTEKTTIPTERPTIPTEKTTIPTERPTIPTEKTSIPTERPTIPLEKTTMPTEKSTVPTERHTAPTTPQLSPTLVPVGPTVLVMPSTTAPSTSMTTTTPRPTPAKCPPNAHYNPCACPASCERPKPSCGPLCKPGCVCNFGFLFRESNCIRASSCNCFYNNKSYKPGAEWFSSNCTERCHCRPGSQIECHLARCGTNTVCQLNNGQYECQPYGTGTCAVYGDPHQVTFDGRHFSFLGKCTYILAQTCGNSTEPFFRVAAKNEDRGQKGMSYLSKIYVTLPGVTITLLKGRETLVGGRQVTLPAIPSKGIFLASSGRFVELQTFGLRVRWDGDQQLFMNVHSTYSRKLCGFCGNYDGDSGNDNWKPDGTPALNAEELGNSWQMAEDEDKECPKNTTNPSSCNSGFLNSLSGLLYCGRLTDTHGAFEACLPHLKTSRFFKNCILDGCKSEGLQSGLCLHMAVLTEICQEAGYPVKPWREPQFCPLTCPPNSRYTVCARPCPATCHSGFFGMSCQERCVEGCECNPGFVLNGLQCVLPSQCGCLEPTMGYLKVGEQWFKPGCRELCACEGKNRIHCRHWKCQSQEVCAQYNGTYGCHARESATCAVSGDPHYLTFDGALHHFMGTCAYILTQPCQPTPLENFTVSTTSEFRSGNLEASYVRAVNVQVFNLKISLIKGYKVMLNGRRVALPLWPAQGRVSIRPSGSFILLYTDFGLQVRYDGNHLVEVTVPSSYAGQLCGLCGNYNNNSLDDNLLPNKRPVSGSAYLGAAWKLPEYSEPGCFVRGAKPFRCHSASEANRWRKGCDILRSYRGPFSQCHSMVSPQSSFVSCVYGQCVTKGDPLTLCRSLQAYASLCAHAGQALSWRNSTFCPLKCPSGSNYSHCANPCPATCLSLNTPRDCSAVLPCTEGCECQKGHILSGTSCVPLSQCGCVDQEGYYHLVGESWYTDNFCSRLCTCSTHNVISCHQTTCKTGQLCRPVDGLLRCRALGMGVCRTSNYSQYVTFDGTHHTFRGTCTYVLVKVCHSTMDLPFFKISGKHRKQKGQSDASYLYQVNVDIFNTQVTLKSDTRVLINGTQVTLPSTTQIQGVRITTSGIYTLLNVNIGLQVKFDGNGFLEVELPTVYYQKVCGMCGNFNGEEEDELMMPDDELAQNDSEFVDSWQDKESNPNCQQDDQKIQAERQKLDINCSTADIARAQEQCQVAFEAPAWAQCATHVVPRRFLLLCIQKLCRFGRLKSALCGSLETFGAACKAKGLKTPIWRNSSFCPLKCPTHSSYSTCLPTCSDSCMDQCNGSQVPSVCKEGCICQPGYVLSGQECVPRSQCGCTDDYGSTFPEGKTWIAVHCTRSCSCTEGSVHCQQFSCPAGSHCEPKPGGVGSCELNRSGQCSIYGDPHYHTFDGLRYLFRGRMTYTLIKTIDGLPAEVVPLVVEGRNKVYSSWSPVFLHEIIVIVYGFTVQLQADLQLVVNNQKMAIPFTPNSHLQVTMRGHRLYLTTDFKMIVTFHGGKNAVITLPSMYKKLVLGLCGNFDGNKRNDFMLPNGTVTDNLVSFSHSWEVQKITGGDLARFSRAIQEKEEKEEEELGFHASECSVEQLRLINSTQACTVLVDPYGPFAACHQTVAPGPFQEHCMFDLCAARNPKEQEELRCQVLSGYAIICQEAGATLASWRDHTHCALACPANTVYQSCMTPCPASCANLAAPRDCEGPCVEGCASLPGYVYSGAWSLPLAHCGCTNNGVYYQRGDSFVTEDCSQRCTCASSGVLLCEPLSCRAGEICTLGNLTRGCFRESPCLQNPCQNDGRCQEQGTHFTCECELGYGGHLCTESRNVPPPRKPEASNFAAILLGMLVPVLVLVPAVTRACVSRKKREKTQS
ncbi:zonadhesin isoform X1 [Canis lupus familiaris]|uniref:zonadhesin isoform X1 n=1 Tax=Canis lupus familiaris TaxID=9615 RepID=UPI0018F7D694|nr:zonadhesin isoform X1 [Canis lupus familiaris]